MDSASNSLINLGPVSIVNGIDHIVNGLDNNLDGLQTVFKFDNDNSTDSSSSDTNYETDHNLDIQKNSNPNLTNSTILSNSILISNDRVLINNNQINTDKIDNHSFDDYNTKTKKKMAKTENNKKSNLTSRKSTPIKKPRKLNVKNGTIKDVFESCDLSNGLPNGNELTTKSQNSNRKTSANNTLSNNQSSKDQKPCPLRKFLP